MTSTCDAPAVSLVAIDHTARPVPAWRSALRRIGAWLVAFARELDRGYAVMYGRRPPDEPSPAELDTLVRTHVIQPPRRQR